MPARESRLHYILLPLAALIAIHPLILHGCSCGHDFDFHILSWIEAATQFLHGNLHPHWAYTPAFNAGEPRFIFYPPLSWTIGAILGLILPWQWTPIIYTWLALTAAGFSLYYLAKEFTTQQAALIAATIYMVNPYTLFTAYERTAYAELLAAAWIPLLLHAILREKVTIPRIAIPVALLWLTNAPAAVMSCYALALLTIIRIIYNQSSTNTITQSIATNPGAPFMQFHRMSGHSCEARTAPAHPSSSNNLQTRFQLALKTAAGTILGLGLAAFYIVPAAYERRYVQIAMAILPGMRIQDNYLFHHTTDHDHDLVLHTASIVAIILITITAAALIAAKQTTEPATKQTKKPATNPGAPIMAQFHRDMIGPSSEARPSTQPTQQLNRDISASLLIPLTILTTTIAFLLTPISAPIWNHAPELVFLQFPWRFLAILAAVAALAIATALSPLKLKPAQATVIALILAAALSAASYTIFKQPCDEEDTVQARLALFHSNAGTDPTDEYTPSTADNDALAHTNPAYWLAQNPTAKAPANSPPAPAPTHLSITTPTPQTLILNLRNYPIWRITSNGQQITTREQRDDGLIAIPLPPGQSNITITSTQLIDQTFGDILTAISLILLAIALFTNRHRHSH